MLGTNQTLWIYELENGGRKQGKYDLQHDGEFCCLGVACEVLESPDTKVSRNDMDGEIEGESLSDQPFVMAKLGLRDDCGVPDQTNPRCDDLVRFVQQMTDIPRFVTHSGDCTLATLNDDLGFTFLQIASVLRCFPELYFNGPR